MTVFAQNQAGLRKTQRNHIYPIVPDKTEANNTAIFELVI